MGNAVCTDYYQTPEEYLAGKRVSREKDKYVAGVVYSMPDPSVGHDRVAGARRGDGR
ncbi:MAG TPA: hypothetical protein VH207_15500 [Chthoniobacterales bacterium]|nr:hypothetical protein [Chthoniobacterales bacterium]